MIFSCYKIGNFCILRQNQSRGAPQNNPLNLSFVKDIHVVGRKMTRNCRKQAIFHFTQVPQKKRWLLRRRRPTQLIRILKSLYQSHAETMITFELLNNKSHGLLPLVDFHSFSLTKQFPITPSAILLIGSLSTFCIDKTVPGFLDLIPFQLLDVTIFVVQQLNTNFVV